MSTSEARGGESGGRHATGSISPRDLFASSKGSFFQDGEESQERSNSSSKPSKFKAAVSVVQAANRLKEASQVTTFQKGPKAVIRQVQ